MKKQACSLSMSNRKNYKCFHWLLKSKWNIYPLCFCVCLFWKSLVKISWVCNESLCLKKTTSDLLKNFLRKKEVSRLFQKVQMIHTQFDPRKKISEFLITVLYFRICYESQRYENKGFWLVGKVLTTKNETV